MSDKNSSNWFQFEYTVDIHLYRKIVKIFSQFLKESIIASNLCKQIFQLKILNHKDAFIGIFQYFHLINFDQFFHYTYYTYNNVTK